LVLVEGESLLVEIAGPCGVLVGGDAASWIEALGTLAAFVVALVVFIQAVSDRRRSQARLVSGYISEGRVKHLAGTEFRIRYDVSSRWIKAWLRLSPRALTAP
jgi:hypothetical protein